MNLWMVVLIAFACQGLAIYWTGKLLAWLGEIPPFTIRSLIQNRGWAVWPSQESTDETTQKVTKRRN